MRLSPIDPEGVSPVELQQRIGAEKRGRPHLVFRDAAGEQHIVELAQQPQQLTIGRAEGCQVRLHWDSGVSRAHARLERLGESDWMLSDEGLSRNGSIVNGERLGQRRRLADGDVLRFGETSILYRAPQLGASMTVTLHSGAGEVSLTPAQRRVLVALCRPFAGGGIASPASNRAIAEELVLSVEAVKTQLRALFEKFEIEPLARDAKRSRLAQRAFETGAITLRDLSS
jgi:FHA domain